MPTRPTYDEFLHKINELETKLASSPNSPRESRRILIMDDDKAVRKIAARMLCRLGYEAETVADGQTAIKIYQKALASGRPFSAVLMDLTIPGGMGGGEAIRELLALDPQTKGIVSSGHATDPIMVNYRQFGFTGVIPKPYDLNELRDIFREVLG